MSRSDDRDSWASKQVHSLEHLELIRLLALRAYQRATRACTDAYPSHYLLPSTPCEEDTSTGTQSASDRSAKPALAGSIPAPCSNMKWQKTYDGFESIIDLEQDVGEAIADSEVVPKEDGSEWQGKIVVTMEYFPANTTS